VCLHELDTVGHMATRRCTPAERRRQNREGPARAPTGLPFSLLVRGSQAD
jgi:hypothetical protein